MKDIVDLDVNKCREFFEREVGKSVPFDYLAFRLGIEYAIEQMQPYFDSIGAGGVSGQRIAQQPASGDDGLDERSAFEAWASGFEIYLGKHKKTGQYVSAEASIAYNAWKARSSIENRTDGADVKHSLTADHVPDDGKMIENKGPHTYVDIAEAFLERSVLSKAAETYGLKLRECDNDFIKEHADALNAPSGFTSHEASAWAIGVEHGMRVALDRA